MGVFDRLGTRPEGWVPTQPSGRGGNREGGRSAIAKGGGGKGGGKGGGAKGGGGKGGKGGGRPEAPPAEAPPEAPPEEPVSQLVTEMRENREIVIEGEETQVKLYGTLLVRIQQKDILLDTGGFFEEITMVCMNETLADYGFKVTAKDGGDTWIVSDGRSRLYRFVDGLKLEGAALDLKPGHSAMAPGQPPKGGGGPTRVVKSPGKGGARFAPY